QILEAVRKASLPGVWSQGVKLAREGAVLLASSSAEETTLRVRAPGLAVAPTVTLYPEALEWSCDCDGKVDPCMHVAAAAVGAAQAGGGGHPPPRARGGGGGGRVAVPARLVYRRGRKDRLLSLTRIVAQGDGREERLGQSLSARGGPPALLTPTRDDLRVD